MNATPAVWAARLDGAALATIESVGFRAVGVPMGMSVYRDVPAIYPTRGRIRRQPWPSQVFYPCPHGSNSVGHTPGVNYRQTWSQAPRRLALKHVLEKLVADARTMGAHGVIGISIQESRFTGGEPPVRQIRMTGTAVRAEGGETSARGRIFTTTMSAAGLMELLLTGRTPIEVTFGNALVSVMPGCVLRHSRRRKGVVEVTQLADASQMAREGAVADLRADAVKAGASEVLGIELDLDNALPHNVRTGWVSVHAFATGTATRKFDNGLDHAHARQIFQLLDRP